MIRRKVQNIVLAIFMIILLKEGLSFIIPLNHHASMIQEENFDPSIIFYTESDEVLRAEKEVSKKVNSH